MDFKLRATTFSREEPFQCLGNSMSIIDSPQFSGAKELFWVDLASTEHEYPISQTLWSGRHILRKMGCGSWVEHKLYLLLKYIYTQLLLHREDLGWGGHSEEKILHLSHP